MRKAMVLVLAGLMAASLTACGSSGKPAAASNAPAGETKTESKAEESKDNTGSSGISGKTVAFIPKLTGNAFFLNPPMREHRSMERPGILPLTIREAPMRL